MRLDKIPQELKDLKQWVVWRSITKVLPDGTEKITKPPFRSSDPSRQADTTDSTTWSTFDEAVECSRNYPNVVAGIGFVFSKDDPYFGIDLDTEKKIKAENLEKRRAFVNQLLSRAITYTEVSPSGDGLHLIGRGRLPISGTQNNDVGAEVYGWDRFFTMTGNVLDETRTQIIDLQDFVDELAFRAPGETIVTDSPSWRRMDLTDEEVIREASNHNPNFAPRFNGGIGCDPGEWSHTYMAVVGMLDKVTGSVAQIERIINASPMVLKVAPSGSGENRLAKSKRVFQTTLSRVRQGNNGMAPFIEHGRQIYENMERFKQERAIKAAEAVRLAEEAVGLLSKGSASLLDAFPQLSNEHKILTRPSGVVGELVAATEAASFMPFTKFAIPSTFAVLSGIISRGYKLENGSGLNLNFILTAPSATGKTQTMKVWEKFLSLAREGLPATPSGPPKDRIINSSTSSIQAMMEGFTEKPSCVWFVEECHAQLQAMSTGKSPVEAALRDAYNRLYDCSTKDGNFSAPLSVAARKANLTAIPNLSVSTFWTTTTSKFDIFSDDALDGFLSRVVIIRHAGWGGDASRTPEPLGIHLLGHLRDRLSAATSLDEAYASGQSPEKLLTNVSEVEVYDLHWQLVETTHAIAKAAVRGDLPPSYVAIARLPLSALRLAGTIAVMDSPYAPSISIANYKWAFGYLLQNIVALLSDIDTGEIGQGAADDTLVVVKTMKAMLREPEFKGFPGIPKNELQSRLRCRKPFVNGLISASKAASATLAHMLVEGQLEEVMEVVSNHRGRPRNFISPVTNHPIWK